MEPADTVHREDSPRVKQFSCLPDRIKAFGLVSKSIDQGEPGTAFGACNRLGMVAPAPGIAILLCTGRRTGVR